MKSKINIFYILNYNISLFFIIYYIVIYRFPLIGNLPNYTIFINKIKKISEVFSNIMKILSFIINFSIFFALFNHFTEVLITFLFLLYYVDF